MDSRYNYFKTLLPKRPENSHKGTFGHVLNIAGSDYYRGAAYFSSIAPLKVGCGLVTLASTENVLNSVSALSPDVILAPLENINEKFIQKFQAVSIGCGLSTEKSAVEIFKKVIDLLKNSDIPIVIDADGLNIMSLLSLAPCGRGQSEGCFSLPNLILTPHPKELSRLMGVSAEEILSQPEFWAKKCCDKYNCTTILKLHETIVADNCGHIYINKTGNSALSHGGSGDVLCGMITGMLAQGLKPFEASCLAVYLHGLTAEIASKELTEYSVLASDLIDYIPQAIKTLL